MLRVIAQGRGVAALPGREAAMKPQGRPALAGMVMVQATRV